MKKSCVMFLFACVALCVAVAAVAQQETTMKLTSPAFPHNGMIPARYTCEGSDISPQLTIAAIPVQAKSLALIVDDPDAPMGIWVHWVVFDIPVTDGIAEGAIPGRQGSNDFGRTSYGGPCPPSGTHRYFFKLYALDTVLGLNEGTSKAELERAMRGHIVAQAELIGFYKRSG